MPPGCRLSSGAADKRQEVNLNPITETEPPYLGICVTISIFFSAVTPEFIFPQLGNKCYPILNGTNDRYVRETMLSLEKINTLFFYQYALQSIHCNMSALTNGHLRIYNVM